MKRNLYLLTLSVLLLSSCGNTNNQETSTSDSGSSFNSDLYQSNGIDISEYKIVVPNTKSDVYAFAASELQSYIKQGTDETLEIVNDSTSNEYEIIMGSCDRNETNNYNFEILGEESFEIKTIDKNLVFYANEARGLLYGVYDFLEALGYRFYTSDCTKIPNSNKIFVPQDMSINWQPTFEYRDTMFKVAWNEDFAIKHKINSNFMRNKYISNKKYGGSRGYIGGGTYLVHTFKNLLPPVTCKSSHPEYYAQNVGSQDNECLQPCFTNFDTVDIVYNKVKLMIDSDTSSNIISISQNDNGKFCQCSKCRQSYQQYGKSGTMLIYINKIAEKLAVDYPNILIDTLSYQETIDVPTGGVKAADNVSVRFCANMCGYHDEQTHCDQFTNHNQRFYDWANVAKQFYVWTYPTAYGDLLAAWSNLYEIKNAINFYAKNKVKGLYQEGYPEFTCEFEAVKNKISLFGSQNKA